MQQGRYFPRGPTGSYSDCLACTAKTRGACDTLCGDCWQRVTPEDKARYLERWRASDTEGAATVMLEIAQRIRATVYRYVVFDRPALTVPPPFASSRYIINRVKEGVICA